jgi:hypothetical protein
MTHALGFLAGSRVEWVIFSRLPGLSWASLAQVAAGHAEASLVFSVKQGRFHRESFGTIPAMRIATDNSRPPQKSSTAATIRKEFSMKRIIAVLIAALSFAGIASAQAAPAAPAKPSAQAPAQTATITGKLELVNGVIALKADGTTYYLPRLEGLAGFIKELVEGATVKLEGYAYPLPNQAGFSVFMTTKLTIAGRDYDLSQGPMGGKGFGSRGPGMMRGGMGGWGGPRR